MSARRLLRLSGLASGHAWPERLTDHAGGDPAQQVDPFDHPVRLNSGVSATNSIVSESGFEVLLTEPDQFWNWPPTEGVAVS